MSERMAGPKSCINKASAGVSTNARVLAGSRLQVWKEGAQRCRVCAHCRGDGHRSWSGQDEAGAEELGGGRQVWQTRALPAGAGPGGASWGPGRRASHPALSSPNQKEVNKVFPRVPGSPLGGPAILPADPSPPKGTSRSREQ